MKRSASAARLLNEGGEGGEGRGYKEAKSIAGSSDAGGSSAPHSPMSPDNEPFPVSLSGNGIIAAEKSSHEQAKSLGNPGGKSGAVASGGKKGTVVRVLLASPWGIDDEGEGKARGGGGGGGDKGEGGEEDDDDEERMENLELAKYSTIRKGRMQQVLKSFTAEQMSRYECYRRSGFQRANMRRLLVNIPSQTSSAVFMHA